VGGDLKSIDILARILAAPFLFWLVFIDFIRMIVGEEPVSRTRRIAQGTPMRMRKLGHPKIAFHSAGSSAHLDLIQVKEEMKAHLSTR